MNDNEKQAAARGPNYNWKGEAEHYRDECDKLRDLLGKVEATGERIEFELREQLAAVTKERTNALADLDREVHLYGKARTKVMALEQALALEQARGQRLVEALKFYSSRSNFAHRSVDGDPEVAEDEYPNWMSGEGEYDLEDGSVARLAIAAYEAKGE